MKQEIPCIPDVGVLSIVPNRWRLRWASRHQILSRLAKYYHVVWMNPPSDWWDTSMKDVYRKILNHEGITSFGDGLKIYDPTCLPKFYRPVWLDKMTTRLRIRKAYGILKDQGCTTVVLYIWRPEYAEAIKMVRHDLSCYHIDDEYSFSESEQPNDIQEVELIKSVGQVFIHSVGLMEKKGGINSNTEYIPNGVDYAMYSNPVPVPADMAKIPKPWIGYTGIIKKQLDWRLLSCLTGRHPEWSFVFVGAHQQDDETRETIRQIQRQGNVHFLGEKNVWEISAYPQHFDVCIMPYKNNAYTNYIYPMKLHEYLAGGKPVVATRIRSLESFQNILSLVDTPEEWSLALMKALKPEASLENNVSSRRLVASEYDWDRLVHQLAETISRRLGPDFQNRFEKIGITKEKAG